MSAPPQIRTPGEVIDIAIRENRSSEWLCYVFSSVFVVCGVVVLLLGAAKADAIISLAGSIGAALFWPSLSAAMKIRRQNVAIRLLEYPLGRADTAKEAANLLRRFFETELVESPDLKLPERQPTA